MSQAGILDIESVTPTVPTLFETDSGDAIPILNTLAIVGTDGVTTSGSGKTVTVSGTDATAGATALLADKGVCSFDSASFTVTNGFVEFAAVSLDFSSISPDAGTDPVVPDVTGLVTFTGGDGIITTGGLNTLDFAMQSPFAGGDFSFTGGDLDITRDTAGAGTVDLTISNTDNTAAASNAALNLSVGGTTSTGDPYVNWLITGSSTYSMGLDNSAADELKITSGSNPSAGNTLWQMTTSGEITMPLQPAYMAYVDNDVLNKTGNGASYKVCDDSNVTAYDQNADYDDNGVFTAPIDGKYSFKCSLLLEGITAAMTDGYVFINASNHDFILDRSNYGSQRSSTGYYSPSVSIESDMDAADTCTMSIVVKNGAGDTVGLGGGGGNDILCFISGNLMF